MHSLCFCKKMERILRRFQGLILACALMFVVIHESTCTERKELSSRQARQLLILCTANGFIPYPGDTTKYIQCVWIGPRWYYYVYNCPPGSGFDNTRKLCVFGVTNAPATTTGASTTAAGSTTPAGSTTAGGSTTTASGSTTAAGSTTAGGSTTPAASTTAGAATTTAGTTAAATTTPMMTTTPAATPPP